MSFTKVELSGINEASGSLSGFRNRIINGSMEISQRGTSFVSPVNGTYTLDRYAWFQSGAMVVTITQSTDVPNNTFQNSLKVDVTTADTSIAAGDFALINQRIEGYNVRDLIGQTFTLSFWVKSPKTGTHCIGFSNGGLNRSYIIEYTVSAANTWEYKSVTVTGGLITAGTWNWTNGVGLNVIFSLTAGSTFQTTAGAWQVGDFQATSNQVNVMDNVANDFFLTGVQLELGPVPSPFERRPYGLEFSLCQRYFEIISMQDLVGTAGASTRIAFNRPYTVPKRSAPNVAVFSGTNTNFNVYRPGLEAANSGISIAFNNNTDGGSFAIEINTFTGLTNNDSWSGRFQEGKFSASAEL